MLIEHPPLATHKKTTHRALWVVCVVFTGLVVAAIVLLATHWPFTRQALTNALQEASGRTVQIRSFSASYFPPGCTAEGISFLRHKHPDGPPIITVEKLTIYGSITGMLTTPKRLSEVRVVGMHMQIPPKRPGETPASVPLDSGPGGKSLMISKIVADGAMLEFLPEERGKEPFRLKIERLAVLNAGSGHAMKYRTTLTNSEPPGEIRAEGTFGPWNAQDIGATPAAGTYTYSDIALDVFHGIHGKGQARGKFSGPLSRLETEGNVEVDGFHIDGGGHTVRMETTYKATVNGTNGDVFLNPAAARFRNTEVEVRGWIAGHESEKGKTAALDVAVPKGRVDDLLLLFAKGQPGMSGNVRLNGKFTWPPGPRKFLEKIRLDIAFGMSGSKFTSPNTQDSVNRISESAAGEKKTEQDVDLHTVLSEIRGDVHLAGGTATIPRARFQVPGADADVHGTYNVLNGRVDLHGTLDTRGHLSDTVTGFKALILKIATPLFKKEHGVRIVPFQITGDYDNAAVSIDWKGRH